MLSVHSPSGKIHFLSSFPLKKKSLAPLSESEQIQAIWISGNNVLQRKEALHKNTVIAATFGLY